MKIIGWLIGIAAIAVVGLIVIGAMADNRANDAQRIVRAALKDPDSAKFSNVRVKEGTAFVCGQVNAKNSFGGYVGPIPFAYDSSTQLAVVINGPKDAFVWPDLVRGCYPDMQIPRNAMEVQAFERSGSWSQ